MTVIPADITLMPDWRVVQHEDGMYWLEFCDPVRFQWHGMFLGPTQRACEIAYQEYQEGETPASEVAS